MKEGRLIFKAEMVRATLEGRKTQTRRIMKVQPQRCHSISRDACSPSGYSLIADLYDDEYLICPQGKPGDQIWVKENYHTFQYDDIFKPSELSMQSPIIYSADNERHTDLGKTRPSIFMCRWMSRIQLEMTGLRIERLNDISEEDAKAEGIISFHKNWSADMAVSGSNERIPSMGYKTSHSDLTINSCPVDAFIRLWESINGPGSFDDRYVWVEEFKVIKP